MLHYEKYGVWPSEKDLWIMTRTKKDETPVATAFVE